MLGINLDCFQGDYFENTIMYELHMCHQIHVNIQKQKMKRYNFKLILIYRLQMLLTKCEAILLT